MAKMSPQQFAQTYMPFAVMASQATGVDPTFILAQAALETEWGKSAPGNNFFGIKAGSSWSGDTQKLGTWEEVGGKRVNTKATFRKYDSPAQSFADWAKLTSAKWPGIATAKTIDEYSSALRYGKPGGYATDSKYGTKLRTIANMMGNSGSQGAALAYTVPMPRLRPDYTPAVQAASAQATGNAIPASFTDSGSNYTPIPPDGTRRLSLSTDAANAAIRGYSGLRDMQRPSSAYDGSLSPDIARQVGSLGIGVGFYGSPEIASNKPMVPAPETGGFTPVPAGTFANRAQPQYRDQVLALERMMSGEAVPPGQFSTPQPGGAYDTYRRTQAAKETVAANAAKMPQPSAYSTLNDILKSQGVNYGGGPVTAAPPVSAPPVIPATKTATAPVAVPLPKFNPRRTTTTTAKPVPVTPTPRSGGLVGSLWGTLGKAIAGGQGGLFGLLNHPAVNMVNQLPVSQQTLGQNYGGYTPTALTPANFNPTQGGSQYDYTTGYYADGTPTTSYTTDSGRTYTFSTNPDGTTRYY